MVPAHEGDLFPVQGLLAVVGDAQLLLAQREGAVEHVPGQQQVVAPAQRLGVHAEVVEQAQQVFLEPALGIHPGDGFHHLGRHRGAEGVELEQAVAPALDALLQVGAEGPGFLDQRVIHLFQPVPEMQQDLVAARQRLLEGVEPLVVPAQAALLGGALDIRHVDVDVAALADTVQPADALLQHFRVVGQAHQHQVLGELEVAALAPDLRGDEHARAVRLGEPRGLPVALQQRHVLVELRGLHLDQGLQLLLDDAHLGPGLADDQHLGLGVLPEESGQPLDPRIRRVLRRGGQPDLVQDTLREARHGGPRVAEHHPARPVPVQQILQRRLVALLDEGPGLLGRRLVARVLLHIPREVRVAVGVEQAQAGEVALQPQLLRGGGEQQQAGGCAGQRLHHSVGRAGLLRGPGQMVGLVHNQQVPACGHRLGGPGRGAGQQADAAQHQLLLQERIAARLALLDGPAARLVEDAEGEGEPAQQLHEPLVDQRVGDQDEGAGDLPAAQQAVQDQAGLDGFTEPHLVGQQHPGQGPAADFVGDVELVRDQVHAPAHEAARGRLGHAVQVL